MGIDIYAKWRNQTKEEKQAQYTEFSTRHGHIGYLREAYHGEPYVTEYLLSEAFESKNAEAKIPAKILRERLPKAIKLARERENNIYGGNEESIKGIQKSIRDFVTLCEKKEKETGEECTIIASY